MPALNSKHHALIQALLTRGPLAEKDFHHLFNGVTGRNPGTHKQYFNDYLLQISKELSLFQFEVRACRNQYDGQVWYGMVNNVSDEQSKLGTKYSVPQLAFYKGILETILQDTIGQGSISSFDALHVRLENQVQTGMDSEPQSQGNVPAAIRNFSMTQKERAIEEFVKDQWLCHTPDGNIGLGVRSFLDLRGWFRTNNVPSCEVCNEAGVKTQSCPNEDCAVRIHDYCLKKKFSQRGSEKVCVSCGTQWPFQVTDEEDVKEEEEEEEELNESQARRPPRQSQASQGINKKRLRSNGPVDSDNAGPSQRRATRSSARQR